jgi:HK97 gp10 family phage protein
VSDAIKGMAELNAYLLKVPALVEANIKRGALAAAAKVIAEQARQNVPVGQVSEKNRLEYGGYPGLLRDSIRVKTFIPADGESQAVVKAGGKAKSGGIAYYAWWMEHGTAAHEIVSKTGKTLVFAGHFSKAVKHPGFAAKPFMLPALDTKRDEAVAAFVAYAQNRLRNEGLDVPDNYRDEA